MLEINALSFIAAIANLRGIAAIAGAMDEKEIAATLLEETRKVVLDQAAAAEKAVLDINAKSAWVSASRLRKALELTPSPVTVGQLAAAVRDIESRLADHCQFIRLFVIRDDKTDMFEDSEQLLGIDVARFYPSIKFDCEEAAKCLGMGRWTASVFHSMRMTEIAIGAIAKRLAIPDPVKATDRSWGNMLGEVRKAIDAQYPKARRFPKSPGAFLDEVYATLDAVKNPWRNATMHVETIYLEHEARHIFNCVVVLLRKMVTSFDEEGLQLTELDLILGERMPEPLQGAAVGDSGNLAS